MKRKIGGILALLAAVTLVGASLGSAAPLKGTITLYTSQVERDAAKLVEGFNELHPGVTVEIFRSGTEEVVSKLLAEHTVQSVLADVLLVADAIALEGLKAQGLLLSYESPEAQGIPEEYLDKDHAYTGTKIMTTGIVYNTNMVANAPKGFADLTKEEYKDQVVMPSPLYSGTAAYNVGVLSRTPLLGWEYFEALKGNGVRVEKANGTVQKAVVSGDRGLGMLLDYMAFRSKKDGAPVEFVYPAEGSPVVTQPIAILNTSKKQDLAKAFVDFVLSKEGQRLAASLGYTPIKAGIPAPEGMKSVDQIAPMPGDSAELTKAREADKEKFVALFQ